MEKSERRKVRNEGEAIKNAIKQGVMNNPADFRYLWTKCYRPDNVWFDVFLNLNTGHLEACKVELWIEEKE